MKLQSPIQILLTAIVLMVGTVGFAQAQSSSSAPARSEEALLLEATQKALAKARAEMAAAEAETERARTQLKALGASLAEANRLANEFRDEFFERLGFVEKEFSESGTGVPGSKRIGSSTCAATGPGVIWREPGGRIRFRPSK